MLLPKEEFKLAQLFNHCILSLCESVYKVSMGQKQEPAHTDIY